MTAPDDPVQSTLDTNLSYRISILHSLLGKLTTRIYAARGLTSHQWKVLSILYNWPPMPAVRITNLVTLDKAAISRGVSGLLRLKFARRYLDNASGMIFIALTDSGRATYRAMAAEMGNLQRELFVNVTDSKQKVFFETVRDIEHQLRAASGVTPLDAVRGRARKAPAATKTSARKTRVKAVGS
jgi:DNA-binding MarR family transcriptional regulator